MIDLHSHVLPCVDDGSASVEESAALLRMEAEQGIRCVVATPHFYANYDDPQQFLSKRAEAMALLQREIPEKHELPEIKLGAEVHFFHGMSDSDVLQRLTIDMKRCILIEMPGTPWTDQMYRELEQIRSKQDLIPIIAHVDRYISRFRTFGIPEKLEQIPVLVQANASFFLNRATSSMALRMLRKNQIHLLGSDCHSVRHRPPRLGEAVELIRKRLGEEPLAQIQDYQSLVFSHDKE